MTHRYRLQEVINGPEPDPEYRECGRCGIRLKATSLLTECEDCKGVNALKAEPSQQRYMQSNFLPVDPAYEVSLHYPSIPKQDPTAATLCSMGIPYFSYYGTRDPLEVDWARNLEPFDVEPRWPIVLISEHGRYLKHWTGYDLTKLNRIPAERRVATGQHEAPEASVPLRQAA